MSQNNDLELVDLACQRGEKIVFHSLTAKFSSGDFIQIDGHNGLGKTSLLRILVTLSQPLEGSVLWNGKSVLQQRETYLANLLYLGHSSGIKSELTSWENLRFYQKVTTGHINDEHILNALYSVGLAGYEESAVYQLSAGQQKRVGLARLYLSDCPLWILDEPFTALDKQGQQQLTVLFEQHCQQGGIVIVTSHQSITSNMLKKLSLKTYQYSEKL